MTNLVEQSVWVDGVFQLETTTPPQGGVPIIEGGVPVAGHANAQALQLANRTKYLKDAIDDIAIGNTVQSIIVACSDETTPITTGTNKVTFRIPYAFKLSGIYADLTTAQTSGSTFTVNVKENGVSILSAKITIDNGEDDSSTAVIQPVISDVNLAARSKITVDVDQIGDGTARGLKVTLIGTPV